jgi:predicted amino acid-binding ACT domain protein
VHIAICETEAFESEDVQRALEEQRMNAMNTIQTVYDGFYKINEKARIADEEVSVKTAQEYLQAVREFENSLIGTARDLVNQLIAKGL